MFNKLQTKWKVSAARLFLIIAVFAIGGTLCGYTSRKLLTLLNIEKGVLWIMVYVITITVLWPIAVILISIPLGQFSFFKRYLRNMFEKIRGKRTSDSENSKTF